MATVRILILIALQRKLQINQLDIPTAFLNGELQSDIYIKTPEGMRINKDNKVLKLNRALYGLKESPKCWNSKFNEIMQKNNFNRSEYDYCLYHKKDVWLLVYVDDILITGNKTAIEETITLLIQEFNAKDLGKINKFLGFKITKNEEKFKLTQVEMVEKLLIKFHMQDCKGVSTPMVTNFQVNEIEETLNNVPYRQLIGSLMYLATTTRPDIMFPVSYLSKFLDKPTQQTWTAAKRVLRYLKSTKEMGLVYQPKNEILKGYTDADFATDKTDRKSVSGSIIMYGENPVAWLTKKQRCVALSTAESEYIAAAATAQELVNIKGILSQFSINDECLLLTDSQSSISMMQNFENSKRSKHIDVKLHFIKHLVSEKVFKLDYVNTKENVADFLTKPLPKEQFEYLRARAKVL